MVIKQPAMSSSVWRIPFLLTLMVGVQISTTPPHPPPSSRERSVESTWLEVILTQRWSVYIIQAISWATALAEMSTIIATRLDPQHQGSHIIHAHSKSSSERLTGLNRHHSHKTIVMGMGNHPRIRLSCTACAAWCIAVTGAYLRVLCFESLGSLFTFEMSIRDDHRLVKDGPYAVVRHPSYLGLLMTTFGLLVWHGSRGSWVRECGHFTRTNGRRLALLYVMMILLIITGLLLRMEKEDEALKIRFGREWDDWAGQVRFKLIPFVF